MRLTDSKRRALQRLEAAARPRLEQAATRAPNAAWSAFTAAALAAFPERVIGFAGPQPFVMQDAPTSAELGGLPAFAAWAHRIADGEETPDDAAVIDALPADVTHGLARYWSMSPRDAARVTSEALRAY
jgi:hypothetical protein